MSTELTKAEPDLPALREPEQQVAITPAQAKVDAIASLTLSAYQRASQLSMSDEEIAALTADFPDEAFKPGAAGKENLIYIEHAFLRERLNSVFRPGQWAIVPRNRWAEDFTTKRGDSASRVYVEAMLCIRGCFAAEAVGEMEYYPNNASQNYGDAVEGAKTAALRRCCKELGIGLQAWKKDWCDGWWARRRNGSKPPGATLTPSVPKNAPTVPRASKDVLPKQATEATKAWFLNELRYFDHDLLLEYAVKNGILLPTEDLNDWSLAKVPTDRDQLRKIMLQIEQFRDGGAPPEPEDDVPYADNEKTPPAKDESFKEFVVPYGKHAGKKLGDLETKTTWGFWKNHSVETEYQGKPKRPDIIAKDQAFRDALDIAGEYYGFTDKAE